MHVCCGRDYKPLRVNKLLSLHMETSNFSMQSHFVVDFIERFRDASYIASDAQSAAPSLAW